MLASMVSYPVARRLLKTTGSAPAVEATSLPIYFSTVKSTMDLLVLAASLILSDPNRSSG